MALDNKLMRYEVPIHCLNDPVRYSEEDLAHRNLNQSFTPEDIRVKNECNVGYNQKY